MTTHTDNLGQKGVAFIILGNVLFVIATIVARLWDLPSPRAAGLYGGAVGIAVTGVALVVIGLRRRR